MSTPSHSSFRHLLQRNVKTRIVSFSTVTNASVYAYSVSEWLFDELWVVVRSGHGVTSHNVARSYVNLTLSKVSKEWNTPPHLQASTLVMYCLLPLK